MSRPEPAVRAQSRIPSSAYKMAIFAAVTILLFGLLATVIGNVSFAPSRTFHAEFTDATGVTVGDKVRLSGVEVGRVTEVRLAGAGEAEPDWGARNARVSFTVDEDVPLFDSATLALRFENIVGRRYLAITEEPGGTPQQPGSTIEVARTSPALNLTVLFNGFQPLFRALDPEQTNRLADLMVRTLQGEGTTYASLMRATAGLTAELADADEVIGTVVDNLGAVLSTIAERDVRLTRLIVTFRDLMQGLSEDREEISAALPGLADLLSVSGDAIADVRGPLRGDVEQLAEVVETLDADRDVIAESLQRLPRRSRAQTRTGSYGSYFNFYVCGLELNVRLLGNEYLLSSPGLSANERATVCAGTERGNLQ
ncbi:MCE family protein [Nocardioides sp. zg-536]|uniref:MCE family protein n=1 Tax=Nocardioides faecalis TaxID=2803858 RepID=A0A938Y6U3_9ACTN|nr:MCE family protein [Nocardioides faecalis]MBM9461133.1 MCE family protein [Nocardioides faecalis]MBS4752213.1 MCE family protein [Nocardioides faecalis]QVI58989.1 MCE family protein [Nocardioides faecalis]